MKNLGARGVSFLSMAGLVIGLAGGPAWAVPPGQDSSLGNVELERVGSIISRESGFAPPEAAPLPIIKRDRRGTIWAAWVKWETGRSRVELASFGGTEIEFVGTVGYRDGYDLSPDFAFSPAGSPWLTWVNSREGLTRVLVQDIGSQETWILTAESSASAAGPKILFDAGGSPWAFWSVTSGPSGEIAYRVFKHGAWTAPALVPRETNWPALNPDAAVDGGGTVWLTWSGYDGQDFRIYLSRWTGTGWAPEIPVSENPGPNLFPSLGFGQDGSPLVVWTRSTDRGRLVCLGCYENGTAGPETCLDSEPGWTSPPKLIQDVGGAAVGRRSGDRIRITSLPQVPAASRPSVVSSSTPPRLPINPQLDENKYAGFGDSITFGYVDFYPYPERGYIPRLNAILSSAYGSQRVVNEGFGGEVTAEGLIRIPKVFIADLPRYLLIMEGTNDVIFTDITIPSAAFNLQEMVRKCLAAGVFPAIATIIPRLDWFGGQTIYQERLLSLNARIRQIAANMSVPLVDMYSAFATYPISSGGVLSLLSKDLKHPSDKGYQFMAETWFSGIRSFPFPPVNVSVAVLEPEIKVPSRIWARPGAAPRIPREAPADPRLPFGNLLTWKHSPKIFDTSKILGYRIYRKAATDQTATFQLLAFVDQPLEYFERGPAVIGRYDYALSTIRRDGIEGPISDIAGK
jgi:lysophospholipase L1-like esterase